MCVCVCEVKTGVEAQEEHCGKLNSLLCRVHCTATLFLNIIPHVAFRNTAQPHFLSCHVLTCLVGKRDI